MCVCIAATWRQSQAGGTALGWRAPPHSPRFHLETLVIYMMSSGKFSTQNDLCEKHQSKRVVMFTETKLKNLSVDRFDRAPPGHFGVSAHPIFTLPHPPTPS